VRERIAEPIEQFEALDAVLEPLQKAVQTVVPERSELKDVLSGTWLGEPLHPPLTDVVIGTWTSALLLDLLGGEQTQKAADGLVAAGVLAAVPTVTAGLSDWAELSGGSRRVGGVHALGNTTALSALGYAVATFSAMLGGHLSFSRGVGVNQTAFEDAPEEWTAVLGEDGLEEGKLTGAQAGGVTVLLVRKEGRLYGLIDRCSHRGCPLHEGELKDDAVVCPCHGSTFRLDGSLVKGPATSPQPALQVRVESGKVEVRRVKSQD
jgi:nitrite reductase/ring-hydroxylating ferredoxin subunit